MDKILLVIITATMIFFFTGCNKSGEAMPITMNNVQEYFKGTNEAANNVEGSLDEVERMQAVAKVPLEAMGYDFDATLLTALKQHTTDPARMALMLNAFSYVIDTVKRNPDESVKKGLVLEETKNKILLLQKYPSVSTKETLTKVLNLIDIIKKCQAENNNICSGNALFEMLVHSGTVAQISSDNFGSNAMKDTIVRSTLMPILQCNLVKDSNGHILSDINNLDQNFVITDKDYAMVKNDLTNPWWLE